ncbi:hypothetical protein L228DRAFT_280282 [Xylona heveae TC161]|uniref:Uncharacterized protein n=1 Tax=Xylona heveae (strain CBS 132557 / TC161) TaxID=1328760 RepID=A0A165IK18_XYLHT|nr:hypothetical protein L228DRAFT_280282 [Xylona heveae TC161]KZF25005.1 hypothetical protein L228DRAFT_280282 [Xylona heveae TC161]
MNESRLCAQPDGAPPAYNLHVSAGAASSRTRPTADSKHEEYATESVEQEEGEEQGQEEAPPSDETPTRPSSDKPLSLTMDADLIYPTEPPSLALYHIPRLLTWHGDRVYLHRSVPGKQRENGTRRKVRDQDLYEIRGEVFTSSVYEIVGKRRGCYGTGNATMKRRRSLFGDIWEISFKNRLVLRYDKNQWKDSNQKLVAVEEKGSNAPILKIQQGVDEPLRDLIVAGWCTQIWRQNTKTDLATTLTRGREFIKTAYGGSPSLAARFAGA